MVAEPGRGLYAASMGGGADIRGVLFDAGGVLIRPIGGRWNPRYDFESVTLRHHPEIQAEWFPTAFAAGQRFLDSGSTTQDHIEYHRVILRGLGVAEPSTELLDELEAPAAGAALETFPGAEQVLRDIKASGVRMSVVSDSWAGLENLFHQLGIDGYFEGFVISEVLGCRKPDPRMYHAGSDLLGLEPAECVFIDDDPELVAAADNLGYHGVALVHDQPLPTHVRAIRTLEDIMPMIRPTGPDNV